MPILWYYNHIMKNCINTHSCREPMTRPVEIHAANDTQLYTARRYAWIQFFDSNKNQYGQSLNGGRDERWASVAKIIDNELRSRGLDPKDKSLLTRDVAPENNCGIINPGQFNV